MLIRRGGANGAHEAWSEDSSEPGKYKVIVYCKEFDNYSEYLRNEEDIGLDKVCRCDHCRKILLL